MAAATVDPGAERSRMAAKVRTLYARLAREVVDVPPLDERALAAMATLPRHDFVPDAVVADAYADAPLAIGHGQTVSQPFIVALMTSAAGIAPGARVLEIGTGSGYQTAVLAALAAHVYSIEVVPALAERAQRALHRLGIGNVTVAVRDGYQGWADMAPFDAILVTAAPPRIPDALPPQLRDGGRLVVPYGETCQTLTLIEKRSGGNYLERPIVSVRFVPLVHPPATDV